MACMNDKHSTPTQEIHKEVSTSRIQADAKDRGMIREKLQQCIDPLAISSETDHQQLIGRITPAVVNVEKAVVIGAEQMEAIEDTWPAGFYGPISNKITTMEVTMKHVKVGT